MDYSQLLEGVGNFLIVCVVCLVFLFFNRVAFLIPWNIEVLKNTSSECIFFTLKHYEYFNRPMNSFKFFAVLTELIIKDTTTVYDFFHFKGKEIETRIPHFCKSAGLRLTMSQIKSYKSGREVSV